MGEATERFFESLPARAPVVLREPVSGTIQINLTAGGRTEHWYVTLRPGTARVSRERSEADVVWQSPADLFDKMATGEAQSIATILRNATTLSGDVLLFVRFRRFFPDPPGTRDPRLAAQERTNRSRDRAAADRDRDREQPGWSA